MCVIFHSTSSVLSKQETYVGNLKCMCYSLKIPLEVKESWRFWEIFGPVKFSGISTDFTLALWVYQGNPFSHFEKKNLFDHYDFLKKVCWVLHNLFNCVRISWVWLDIVFHGRIGSYGCWKKRLHVSGKRQ